MTDKIHKTLNGEHVRAMVKALETAGIPVKKTELGGYFVKVRRRATGERVTAFSAILVRKDTYLVSHDADLFEKGGAV